MHIAGGAKLSLPAGKTVMQSSKTLDFFFFAVCEKKLYVQCLGKASD